MIIYFTGTGNSRYVAKALSQQLSDTLQDATKLIKLGEKPCFESEKPFIFVAPVYAWRMPRVFEAWLKASKFSGNKYAYFVFTCGGDIGAAANYTKPLCAELGLNYKGTQSVVMPENYLVMFTPTPESEDAEFFANADKKISDLAEIIATEGDFTEAKISIFGKLESGFINWGFNNYQISAKKFYATDACVSCGKCLEVCMLNNIVLKDGRPVWGEDCTHCVACICHCPTQAIEYGKTTKGKRRYVCQK